MKLFKNNTEAEKGWRAVVYKMREAEKNSQQLSPLEEKINYILNERKVNNTSGKKAKARK